MQCPAFCTHSVARFNVHVHVHGACACARELRTARELHSEIAYARTACLGILHIYPSQVSVAFFCALVMLLGMCGCNVYRCCCRKRERRTAARAKHARKPSRAAYDMALVDADESYF